MRRLVPLVVLAISSGQGIAQQSNDSAFMNLGAMQAALIFATDKCPGSLDPNAEAAVAAVASQDPQRMKAIVLAALVAINQQAQRVGVSKQCKTIVDAYGPKGTVNAGAWRPLTR